MKDNFDFSPIGRIYMVNHWLMKSEPHVYPWEQLVADGSTHWDGVRNYQARNIMRDQMRVGDYVLFYHSNCKPPHVSGVARVCKRLIQTLQLKMLIQNTSILKLAPTILVG